MANPMHIPPSSTWDHNAHRQSDPSSAYAFLVHAQSIPDQQSSPKPDDKTLTRQKRRRTSPEDHAILEAEYQKNSKPDKAARAEIVKKVALEEKAVQIWFQNRRQNDRRKSRPLLPHELIPHLRNPPVGHLTVDAKLSHAASSDSYLPLQTSLMTSSPTGPSLVTTSPLKDRASSRNSSIHDLLNPTNQADIPPPSSSPCSSTDQDLPVALASRTFETTHPPTTQTPVQDNMSSHVQAASLSDRASQGRKRIFEDVDGKENISPTISTATSFTSSSQDKSSGVRLSMSLDGAVKVKTSHEETPSPPKQRPVASHPVAGPDDESNTDDLLQSKGEADKEDAKIGGPVKQSKPLAGTFGRSRDARTWEFYCDNQTRDALALQAEREGSGSAVGAISLIRSQSKKSKENLKRKQDRNALTPKTGGGNTQVRSVDGVSKPKLSRAQSSMGRLQHEPKTTVPKQPAGKGVKGNRPVHVRTNSDSDKENWAPGTRDARHPLRRTQTSSITNGTHSARGNVLQENGPTPSHTAGHLGAWAADRKQARNIKRGLKPDEMKENTNDPARQYDTDEIAAFMTANGSGNGKEKEDDIDCIQGLLSLSQGAWK